MLATDATEAAAAHPLLETWARNEPMRHVPTVDWIVRKIESDLRPRIDKLVASFIALAADHPQHGVIEIEIRALCRAIDRLADVAKHTRGNHPPHDLRERLAWGLNQAISCLQSLDPTLIGRRYPFHTFERSKSEPLYGALLVVINHVERLVLLVRTIDRNIDERLLEGLVQLETPLREQPIA